VASEAEEAVAGDELTLGSEVLDASSSGVLRGEWKVGVWFPGLNDDGVVGKGGDGESRVASFGGRCGKRGDDVSHGPTSRRVTQGGGCMCGAWSGRGGWPAAPT
jgi:hypothetical protein